MNLIDILQQAGFKGERLREAWAIVMRESGGRPDAHNTDASTGDNSYGLFQINMLGDLGPARDAKFKKYVKGYTGPESLFDPVVNARAAAYMSQKGSNWDSWVSPTYGRAADYLRQFPGEGGKDVQVTTRSGSKTQSQNQQGTATTAESMYGLEQDSLSMKDLKRDYGIAAGVLKQNPDLKRVFQQILTERITDPSRQAALLAETDYFKKHTEDWMQIQKDRQAKDPALWEAAVGRRAQLVEEAFQKAGAEITPEQARDYAEKLIYGSGWNGDSFEIYDEVWLQDIVAGAIDFTQTKEINGIKVYDFEGDAGLQATNLYNLAYQYGIDSSMSNQGFTSWFENSMRGLVDGSLTQEQAQADLQDMAMSRFPGLQSQLQRGLTVRQAADPYIKVIGDTLGYSDGQIDLNDDLVQRVLNYTDEQGNFKPMSLYDAKLAARRDERWQYTDQAKGEYTSLANQILKDFGFLG